MGVFDNNRITCNPNTYGSMELDDIVREIKETPILRIDQNKELVTFNDCTYDDIYEKILARLSLVPTVEHKCHNCGGVVELDAGHHVFHCPYCNSVYAIGTRMVNA